MNHAKISSTLALVALALTAPVLLGGCHAGRARAAYQKMEESVYELTYRVVTLEAQMAALQIQAR